jgi:aryl-alcohol dehydrogenase-like predicted oxidoreductase
MEYRNLGSAGLKVSVLSLGSWPTFDAQIDEVSAAAEAHHLHKPQMEQPQYNLFVRNKVEQEYTGLYEGMGLGLTTWSPLASGVLTGKYSRGIPKDSRLARPGYDRLREKFITPQRIEGVKKLEAIAKGLGATTAQ